MRKTLPLILTSIPFMASAEDTEATPPYWRHEISGDASAKLGAVGDLGMRDRSYSFYGSGGYDYALDANWQIGANLGFFFGNSTGSYGGGSLMLGPTYNFTGKDGLQNAVFVSLKAGFSYAKQSGYDSYASFSGDLAFGKRWQITESVSYKPYVGASS